MAIVEWIIRGVLVVWLARIVVRLVKAMLEELR